MDCKWLASKEFEEKYSYDGQLGVYIQKGKKKIYIMGTNSRES